MSRLKIDIEKQQKDNRQMEQQMQTSFDVVKRNLDTNIATQRQIEEEQRTIMDDLGDKIEKAKKKKPSQWNIAAYNKWAKKYNKSVKKYNKALKLRREASDERRRLAKELFDRTEQHEQGLTEMNNH